jgi:hypothetical protein
MKDQKIEDLEETNPLEEIEEEDSQPDIIEKKPRTQKQIDAFKKVRDIRDAKRVERNEVRVKESVERKQIVNEKITKKALSLQKKRILQDAEIDAISDEDIPVDVVKKIMSKYAKKKAVPSVPKESAPVYTFI